LDQRRVDFDSKKAPQQLRLILLEENPKWKVPERRVARYLKKQLNARNNPKAEEIDADIDEETAYTNISKQTISTLGDYSTAVPSSIVYIPEDESREEVTPGKEQTIKGSIVEQETIKEVAENLESKNNLFVADESAKIILNREMDDMSPIEHGIAKIDEEGNDEISPTEQEKTVNDNKRGDSHLQNDDINKYYTDDSDGHESPEKNCFGFNFVVFWCR